MNDASSNTKSRKLASRLMLGTAILALPLTASITYAESVAPKAPPAPPAPAVSVAPPAPPTPPAALLSAGVFQDAPDAPDAPNPPEPPEAVSTIVTVDPDSGATETIDVRGAVQVEADEIRVMKIKDKDVYVWRDVDESDGQSSKTRYKKVKIIKSGEPLSKAEIEEIMIELREGLAEADEALEDARVDLAELLINSEALAERADRQGRTIVKMSCSSDSDDVATTKELDDGTTQVLICQSKIMAQALSGLEMAREAIAENERITGQMRENILKELDQQIEKWNKEAR